MQEQFLRFSKGDSQQKIFEIVFVNASKCWKLKIKLKADLSGKTRTLYFVAYFFVFWTAITNEAKA